MRVLVSLSRYVLWIQDRFFHSNLIAFAFFKPVQNIHFSVIVLGVGAGGIEKVRLLFRCTINCGFDWSSAAQFGVQMFSSEGSHQVL